MNDKLIALCTPDAYRPSAKALIAGIKATNLANTDLIILDNGYDTDFQHAETMNAVLDYADDQWVFFIDDDVLIDTPDWLNTLVSTAQEMDAAVVGCTHTYRSGEINHSGALIHDDGSTELLREPFGMPRYVPAVSSAVVGVRPGTKLRFDTRYAKYQHDLDLCVSAWQQGLKVAVTPQLSVVHDMAGYYSTLSAPALAYQADSQLFRDKWASFCRDGLYRVTELEPFRSQACGPNWEVRYNQASACKRDDPTQAAHGFQAVAENCPYQHLVAGAHFHLFELTQDIDHLRSCVAINPLHGKAQSMLLQYEQSGIGEPREAERA